MYADSKDSNTVVISDFAGNSMNNFPLNDGELVVSIAFAPDGRLGVLTSMQNLITLTQDPCPTNYTLHDDTSRCVCNPTF